MKAKAYAIICILTLTLGAGPLYAEKGTKFEDQVLEALMKNPLKTFMVMEKIFKMAPKLKQEAEIAKYIENPVKVNIRSDEIFRGGGKNAPITLVEYSDFQCGYCLKGFETVQKVLKKYGKKVRFVYKHNPLPFHKAAMPAAQYYEAMRVIGGSKAAITFHDDIFAHFKDIPKTSQEATQFFEGLITKKFPKIDIKKLRKIATSKETVLRIKNDSDEAQRYGLSGTPGFIINGVPVPGAYPASHFDMIIEKLRKSGKLKI